MNIRSSITTTALALAGFGLWSYSGNQLRNAGTFDYKPNPLGLKMSPYGQVIAMAIQAPIDADWHGALEIHDLPGADQSHAEAEDCDDVACDHDHSGHDHAGHDQEPEVAGHGDSCSDPDCGHDHGAPSEATGSLIDRLSKAVTRRNNPNPPTVGHKFYIRRQIEKKLRFAYELDPSHYANYAAYNLFLTTSSLGTGPDDEEQMTKNVIHLAEGTIRYCLHENNDPRPALTAASAAYNILERQFLHPERHSISEMREQLGVLDFCLKRHFELLQQSIDNGNWSRLSEMRQDEILKRSDFALKLRESVEGTITRLENEESSISTAQHDPS